MPNTTVRANARILSEATKCAPQPAQTADELQALAADFEVALEALRPFFIAPAVTMTPTPQPRV